MLTSNRTREVHDALKRRCLYLWLDHPDLAREIEILHSRLPGLPERLAAQVAGRGARSCARPTCSSRPASPRRIDWARALQLVGARHLDVDSAAATLGAVLKYREDADRVRDPARHPARVLRPSMDDHRRSDACRPPTDDPLPGLVGFTAVLRNAGLADHHRPGGRVPRPRSTRST